MPIAATPDGKPAMAPAATSPRRSPFAVPEQGATSPTQHAAGVVLRAETMASVVLIATWQTGVPALEQALETFFAGAAAEPVTDARSGAAESAAPAAYSTPLGLVPASPSPALPLLTGQTAATSLGLLARTGPQEFLLISEEPDTRLMLRLRQTLSADLGAVTDLSHARCRIRVHGPKTRAALSKLFALDLRESSFPIGQLRLTGTHHVPSLLYRTGVDAFDWVVFTSYAQDQLDTLADAALEFGVEIKVEA